LVELLVVVLIIGVLASVALPLYQNAVDKSRWARLVSPARSIANAEEAIHMSQGKYTTAKEDLVVSLPTDSDLSYSLYTTENGDAANFVRVESSKLDDVRLARYYSENGAESDMVFCEAKSGNGRAEKLCGKLLKGAEMSTTDDGYKAYLIEGQNACMSGGMPYDGATGVCGWIDTVGQTVNSGGVCIAQSDGMMASMMGQPTPCSNTIINDGGECRAEARGSYGCGGSQIYDGGICTAAVDSNGCSGVHIYDGGVCTEEEGAYGCSGAQIDAGGVCNGNTWMSGCRGATISGICNGIGDMTCTSSTIESGGVCNGDGQGACSGYADLGYISMGMGPQFEQPLVVKSGGTCNGNAAGACSGPRYGDSYSNYPYLALFESGSVCNGNASGSCSGKFQAGAKCYANVAGACIGDYSEGGCCVGANCPSGTQCS
ncbi:MAG: hypothetical protein IKO35_01915, partial [Elusimicrobiaceae bacterium]|nr:hypothetical protein [Elusimicrobiaceae bacterium]